MTDLTEAMIRSARAALESGHYGVASDMCRALDALTVHQAVQDGADLVYVTAKDRRPAMVPFVGQTRDETPERFECARCGGQARRFRQMINGADDWIHDEHVDLEGYMFQAGDGHKAVRE